MKTPLHTNIAPLDSEHLKQLAYNEKMAELGQISAGVVHELNAPLSVIISAAQMIMREPDVSEFVHEMVGRINSEAQRLSLMTRGLLNFSRYEDGDAEADGNLTVGFVLDFLSFEAARRGITLLRKLDHQLPLVKVSANVLKQILLNLIMNALQAMEENGGTILVETREERDNEVTFVVADTGPGILDHTLARIFEPYFTTKKPGEGTGLGLYVTKTLVESLGGRITVSSAIGDGTTFRVTFPTA